MLAEQEVDLIRRIPIFGAIPPAMQKLLCFSSERLTYEPGQVLFREGEAPDAAYIVIEGDVEISVRGAGGPLAVNRLGRNAILGEAAILGDLPRTATATAAGRVEALRITRKLFCGVIRQCPDAALQLNRLLAQRLANATAQLGALARAGA